MMKTIRRYPATIALACLLLLVIVPLWWHYASAARDCHHRGGQYVRTLTGYACVESAPPPGR